MSVPSWVPVNAKIYVDFLGNRAWTETDGLVAIDAVLGSDPNTAGYFGTTAYNPGSLAIDGYGDAQPVAVIGSSLGLVLSGCTVVLHLQSNVPAFYDDSMVLISVNGQRGLEMDVRPGNDVTVFSNSGDVVQVSISGVANADGDANKVAWTITPTRSEFAANGSAPTISQDTSAEYAGIGDAALVAFALILLPQNRAESIAIYNPLPNTAGLSDLSSLVPLPVPEPIKGVTMGQAMDAVRSRLNAGGFGFPLYFHGDDAALLPDQPADFAFSVFNNEGSSLVAFGGGRGNNVYRNRARNEVFVFAPLGKGGKYVADLAEPVAAQLRSYRDEVISCFMSDVVSVGPGSTLSVPGLNNEVNNYQCAIVESVLFFDQWG